MCSLSNVVFCSHRPLSTDDSLSANKVRFGGEEWDLSASPADWPYAFGIAILTVLSGMAIARHLGQMDAEGYELDEDATHLYRKRCTQPDRFTNEDNVTYNSVIEAINSNIGNSLFTFQGWVFSAWRVKSKFNDGFAPCISRT